MKALLFRKTHKGVEKEEKSNSHAHKKNINDKKIFMKPLLMNFSKIFETTLKSFSTIFAVRSVCSF